MNFSEISKTLHFGNDQTIAAYKLGTKYLGEKFPNSNLWGGGWENVFIV